MTTPMIIKETSNGYIVHAIQDEMLLHREIECVGVINEDSVNALILQLRYLERIDPDEEITLYINSPGGEVSSGLALYDVMKAVRCPIRTVCVGLAASMGAVLFAAGDQRELLAHSRVMIHDPLIAGGGIRGSATYLDAQVKDLMNTRQIIAGILSEHTHRTVEEVLERTAKDTYFYAEDAIAFGLADKIITRL